MKANELRIGNWVNDGFSTIELEAIDFVVMSDAPEGLSLKPLPITEQWLVDFGFEKTDDYGDQIYYELKTEGSRGYYVCFDHEEWVFGLSVRNECTCLIYDEPHFQYVHQLQNLYFALTGEELTLKEQ